MGDQHIALNFAPEEIPPVPYDPSMDYDLGYPDMSYPDFEDMDLFYTDTDFSDDPDFPDTGYKTNIFLAVIAMGSAAAVILLKKRCKP